MQHLFFFHRTASDPAYGYQKGDRPLTIPSRYTQLIQVLRYLFLIGYAQPFQHLLLARRRSVQIEVGLETHPDFLHLIVFDSFHLSTPLFHFVSCFFTA